LADLLSVNARNLNIHQRSKVRWCNNVTSIGNHAYQLDYFLTFCRLPLLYLQVQNHFIL